MPREADAVAARGPALPPGVPDDARLDARDLELVTIDPAGSRDLDQAFHAERQPHGYRVHYAIADVAAFVAPGGALDREAFERGETLYLPDGRAPLYPDVLGEGAASLLPAVDRPALLWTFELDAGGAPVETRCERATVRSRAARSYAEVQGEIDRGDASPSLALLREIGEHLLDRERDRGGVSIAAPGQEVVRDDDGSYSLELEAPLPVETWNAQISLLTGREAARLMAEGGVGLLRTLPPPDDGIVARLRRTARALGVDWPDGLAYADVVRGLRPTTRAHATFLLQALHALRGAGYAVVTPGVAPAGARGRRCALRTRDRAVAPAGRPVRQRGGARRRERVPTACVGGRSAASSRRRDAARRSARRRGRPGLHRRGGGRDPRAARGLHVSRHGGRPTPARRGRAARRGAGRGHRGRATDHSATR